MGNKALINQSTTLPSFFNKNTSRMDSTTEFSDENQHVNLVLKKRARYISANLFSQVSTSDHEGSKLKASQHRTSLVAVMSGENLDKPVEAQKKSIHAPSSSLHDAVVARRDSKSIITISAHTLVAATANTHSNGPTIVNFGPDRKTTMHRPSTPSPPSQVFDSTILNGKKSWAVSKLNECFVSGKSEETDYYVGQISEMTPCP